MKKDFIRLNLIIFGLLVSLILFVAGVVARVESLPLAAKRLALSGCFARDFVRGRMSEAERQV